PGAVGAVNVQDVAAGTRIKHSAVLALSKIWTVPVGGPKAAIPSSEMVAVVVPLTTVGSGVIDWRVSVGVAATSTRDPPVISLNGAQLKHSIRPLSFARLRGTLVAEPSSGLAGVRR